MRSGLNRRLPGRNDAILGFIFLGGMISYLDRAVMGVLAPLIGHDLKLDPAQLGLAFSLFYVGYGICTFFGGWAADRFGPKLVVGVSMVVWSLLCGMTGLVTGLTFLLVVRFLFGAWEAPWIPASNKMLSQLVSPERFAMAFGLTSAGQPIGVAVAGPLIALSAVHLGWRASFLLVSLVGLVWVAGWWPIVSRSSAGGPTLQPEPEVSASAAGGLVEVTRLRDVLRQPALLATCFSIAGANYVQTLFLTWFPSYLSSERGMSTVEIGMITTIPWGLAAVGMVCGGFLSGYLVRRIPGGLKARKFLMAGCMVPAGMSLLLVPIVPSTALAVALMTGAMSLLFLNGPNYFAAVNELAPPRFIGSAMGLLVVFSTAAGSLSPLLTGLLVKATGNYVLAFVVAAGTIFASAAAFVVFANPSGQTRKITPLTDTPLTESGV